MHNSSSYCTRCKASVSEDLSFCPLCGKFVKNDGEKPQETAVSYPIVNTNYIYIVRWIKVVKAVLTLLAILSVVVNLLFKTKVLWFPYVLAGLICVWRVCFYPFKEGKSHITNIPITGIIVALVLIFIDVYNHVFIGNKLGWALAYAAPLVLAFTNVVSFILALIITKEEQNLTKGMFVILFTIVLFWISKVIWFKWFLSWPIYVCILSSFTLLFVLFLIKKRRLPDKLNRDFHI